ncbi:resolvase [Streptomyces sp. NBC_00631]|uniref:resolvase n=1 Tax=Streptomyces sp. NBC_00631 TaxID=2975793 RepID=UPI0030E4B3BA
MPPPCAPAAGSASRPFFLGLPVLPKHLSDLGLLGLNRLLPVHRRPARDHGVSRGAIRTAVADLLPDHAAIEEDSPAPELPATLDMPGKVADFLRASELDPAERDALDQGVTVRRGQGYTVRVSAVPAVHLGLLACCRPLDGGHGTPAVPAQCKARREYENRVSALTPAGP